MKRFANYYSVLLLAIVTVFFAGCTKDEPNNGGDTPNHNGAGLINGLYTINEDGGQVKFSQGNLWYIGSADEPYWKFAEHQTDYIGYAQEGTAENIDRDLFGFAANGYNHGAVCYQPWCTSTRNEDYFAYGDYTLNLYDQTGMADWGRNAIRNGGNQANYGWRTLTKDEWVYLFNERATASGIRYVKGIVNSVNGIIVLPDNWNSSDYVLNNINDDMSDYAGNTIPTEAWNTVFETKGVVFLPAAGYRCGSMCGGTNSYGDYWSSTVQSTYSAYIVNFRPYMLDPQYTAGDGRFYGRAVRLVMDAK